MQGEREKRGKKRKRGDRRAGRGEPERRGMRGTCEKSQGTVVKGRGERHCLSLSDER